MFSTVTTVARKRLNVTYVRILPVVFKLRYAYILYFSCATVLIPRRWRLTFLCTQIYSVTFQIRRFGGVGGV